MQESKGEMSRQVRYNSDKGHKRGDGASKGNQNITVEGKATRKKEGRKYDFKRGCTKGKKSRGASSNMAAGSLSVFPSQLRHLSA